MRAIAAAGLLALLVASCGDAPGPRLVSPDAGVAEDEGCVVPPPPAADSPRTWRVREGDTLRRIARRVYGDEALWKAIRDANPDRVAKDGGVRADVDLVLPWAGL